MVVGIGYRSVGPDTGFNATAYLQVPIGFQIVGDNPLGLGNIGPSSSWEFAFNVILAEDIQEAVYTLFVTLSCVERHVFQKEASFSFTHRVPVNVVESPKKKFAKTSLAKASSAKATATSSLSMLEKAGDLTDDFVRRQAELMKRFDEITSLFIARQYDKVSIDSEVISSEINKLGQDADLELQALQREAEDELRESERELARCKWANETRLKLSRDDLSKAKSFYTEGKYVEAKKFASTSMSNLPTRPLFRRFLDTLGLT